MSRSKAAKAATGSTPLSSVGSSAPRSGQAMQLTLFPSVLKPPAINGRTSAQEAALQASLAIGRAETLEQEEIGRSLYSDFTRMLDCSHDRYIHICRLWHKSKGRDLDATGDNSLWLPAPIKKQKPPIRQWSVEAKQRKRLTELHKKMRAKYSFPDMRHQAIQTKVLTNPDYYGVCPLPSEFECKYYPPNLAQQAAIELENKMRLQGY